MRTKNFSINTINTDYGDGECELFLIPVPFFTKDKKGWAIGLVFLRWGIEIEVSDESE